MSDKVREKSHDKAREIIISEILIGVLYQGISDGVNMVVNWEETHA